MLAMKILSTQALAATSMLAGRDDTVTGAGAAKVAAAVEAAARRQRLNSLTPSLEMAHRYRPVQETWAWHEERSAAGAL